MLMVYKNKEEFINNILIKIKNYKPNGKRIQNVYDLINGLFLVSLLIFNLFNINLLLILTIPFGVYGLIIIYNFFDTNLNKENISKNDYNVYNNIIKSCKIKKEELEEEINGMKIGTWRKMKTFETLSEAQTYLEGLLTPSK